MHTILSLFADRAAAAPHAPAVYRIDEEGLRPVSWRQLALDACRLAAALTGRGVAPGDRVAQFSENRYEWLVVDLAVQIAGAVHVPAAAPLTGPQVCAQLADCAARALIVSTPQQAARFAACGESLDPGLLLLAAEACGAGLAGRPVERLADLMAAVDAHEDALLERLRRAAAETTPDRLATLLYTSGTTGAPKGVMLSQGNLASNTRAKVAAHGLTGDDLRLGVLPLSHVFGRTCDWYVSLATGSALALGRGRERFFDDCRIARPTYLNAVPYFFDKCERVLREAGRQAAAGALRTLLGGRIRTCLCGGAPLPPHVYEFFWQQEVPLLEGYGLTEASPVVADCTLAARKPGSVGRAIPGVEIRLAEDGEILTRGPHVMQGYWRRPRETAEVLRDGWLHTGDLGRIDDEGFLTITGRKKEMLITAGGLNVAPAPLEARLAADPLVLQAMVVGEGRNYLAALIVPDAAALRVWAAAEGLAHLDAARLLDHPRVVRLYQERIAARLADLASYQQVRRFRLLERPFSLERDELTAKGTLRRAVIAARYADTIEALYCRAAAP